MSDVKMTPELIEANNAYDFAYAEYEAAITELLAVTAKTHPANLDSLRERIRYDLKVLLSDVKAFGRDEPEAE